MNQLVGILLASLHCSIFCCYLITHIFLSQLMIDLAYYSSAGNVGAGFGIGALEALDVEDEDVYASG